MLERKVLGELLHDGFGIVHSARLQCFGRIAQGVQLAGLDLFFQQFDAQDDHLLALAVGGFLLLGDLCVQQLEYIDFVSQRGVALVLQGRAFLQQRCLLRLRHSQHGFLRADDVVVYFRGADFVAAQQVQLAHQGLQTAALLHQQVQRFDQLR